MLLIACNEHDDAILESACRTLKEAGIIVESKMHTDAHVVSIWGDDAVDGIANIVSQAQDEYNNAILSQTQKASFWAYASGSLSEGLEADGYDRLSDLYERWCQDCPDVSPPVNVSVVIEVRHFECDVSDDYIEIIAAHDTDEDEVIESFKQALRNTKQDAEKSGCRFSWLDMAIAFMSEKYISAAYCEKQPESECIDLDWARFDPS